MKQKQTHRHREQNSSYQGGRRVREGCTGSLGLVDKNYRLEIYIYTHTHIYIHIYVYIYTHTYTCIPVQYKLTQHCKTIYFNKK